MTSAAIAAAAPGDRIFVAPGLYGVFELDKAVEIRGAGPLATRVTGFKPAELTRVAGIPAGATATIAGVAFDHTDPSVLTDHPVLEVDGNAGTIALQDVRVNTMPTAYHLGPGLRAADTYRLVVQDCVLRGSRGSQFGGAGDSAVDAANVSLVVTDSALGAAVELVGSSLVLAGGPGNVLRGGAGALAAPPPRAGLR